MYYSGYDLNIQSDMVFEELSPSSPLNIVSSPDVIISKREIDPTGLASPDIKGLYYQYNATECWVHVPNVAYFLMLEGHTIHYTPYPGVPDATVKDFVLSLCLSVLLLRRNMLLFRGTCLKIKDKCILIGGESGAGKSTLAAALLQRGYPILSDEFSAVTTDNVIIPGFPFLKLWKETLNRLKISAKNLQRVRPGIQKYIFPLKEIFFQTPLPLTSIYLLCDMNQEDYSYETIKGLKKLNCLNRMIYGAALTRTPAMTHAFKLQTIKVAQAVSLHRITRPSNAFKLEDCIEYIEKNLTEREVA